MLRGIRNRERERERGREREKGSAQRRKGSYRGEGNKGGRERERERERKRKGGRKVDVAWRVEDNGETGMENGRRERKLEAGVERIGWVVCCGAAAARARQFCSGHRRWIFAGAARRASAKGPTPYAR